MNDAMLLIAPVGVPLLGAALTATLRRRPGLSEGVALFTTLALVAAALALLARSLDGGQLAVNLMGDWPGGIAIAFTARLPGPALVLTTALIALAVALYSHAEIGPRRRRAGYDAMMLAMLAAINGAFLTGDLFNLYVWFELALVAALCLITLDRRLTQIGGAIRYAAFSMLAATAILAGIALIYGVMGTLDLPSLTRAFADRTPGVATATAAALLLGGFALKSGLVPLHVWLPASYAPAPISASAAFAGLLTKMGFYALLLVFAGMFAIASGGIGAVQMAPLFSWIAAATMILCALSALVQGDMRRLLGYHVMAQVGYMMAGLATGTREGVAAAIFYMVHSMIVQANLFLGAGAIRRATGSWTLRGAGGMIRSNPLFTALFAVPMLSLAGIPPLSGFWAKLLVIRAGVDAGMLWLIGAVLLSAVLTIVSVATLWSEACWKELRGRRARKVPPAMLAGMALLSLATLFIGLAPDRLLHVADLSATVVMALGVQL